ncbi:MAG TPA: chromosomal replication initiator protein DnaA [Dehalococcoidales bacterium]|nr:chromosomal replication initiator protein DnaA [Dehalococcoidales bacterium]
MELTRCRTPQEIWETALGELQVQVSKPNYRTWFSKTTGLSYQDNQFVIGVPNTFAAEYLDKNQRSLIEKALIGLTSPDVQVLFQVNGKPHHHVNSASEPVMPPPPPSRTRLNPRYTFDSFIEGSSNRMARAAALSVAQNPGHSYNPLFIYGGAGLGKTHLIHAIGQAAAANHINVICTSAEQFTNEFVSALREKTTEEFRNKYRSIGMLLVDDIHFIGGKEQTEESFFHTFNELHNTNRQIVITSDCPPKSMPLLEERLRSRFEWGLIVDIQPPDNETRLAILQSKARQQGVDVASEVLELIAREAPRNIRVLEGSLNRVVAFAKLLRVAPTLDIAAKALEDVASKEYLADAITPCSIVQAVSECFQLPMEELLGRKRDKDTALARRLAMYLIRQETNCSLAQIGQELGNRDAASVTTACKKIASDISESPFLKRKIRDIQRQLHSKLGPRNLS